MQAARELIRAIYARLGALESIYRLFVRVSVGLMFFGGAIHKVGNIGEFTEYLRSLGVPAAEVQGPFVAGTELVASFLLMIGLLTRPAAVALTCVMTVALLTAGIPDKHITATWGGLLDFLYLNDWLLILLLLWMVLVGPGRASADQIIAQKLG